MKNFMLLIFDFFERPASPHTDVRADKPSDSTLRVLKLRHTLSQTLIVDTVSVNGLAEVELIPNLLYSASR